MVRATGTGSLAAGSLHGRMASEDTRPGTRVDEAASIDVDAPGGTLVHLPVDRAASGREDPARRGDVDEWGRSEHMRELARMLYDPIYRSWFRAEWEGLEKIPKHGGALLVANHAGAIPSDAPVIMHGIETELHRPVYGLADHLFKSLPVVGTLWSRVGGVVAHPDNAYRLLRDKRALVLVFPEGTKGTGKHVSERYRLRRFGRGGFVEIAMQAGVPIIPIAVVGAEEAMPIIAKLNPLAKVLRPPLRPDHRHRCWPSARSGLVASLPAKFRLRVLDPIHFDVPADQERYSKSKVMDAADDIRQRIQDQLFDMIRTRRSVWLG